MIIKKTWQSPTFTQYGKYFALLGSVVFVLPLVFTTFDTVDISIWLLISSVTAFSRILSQRLSITFLRVVAFAFSGAKTYGAINDDERKGKGKPNWQGIKDIFVTLDKTFFQVSFIATILAILGLAFGISNIVNELKVEHLQIIVFVALSVLLTENFKKYSVFLMGFNEVALLNRWNTLLGIIGVISAVLVVKLGGNLACLIFIQSLIPVISGLIDKLVFNNYLARRSVKNNGEYDQNILRDVKEPLWKGLVAQSSQIGVLQLSGIIFTMYGTPSIIATYLFSLKVLTMLAEFSQVPFSSKQPYYSMLRAEAKIELLAKIYQKRIFVSVLIYTIGILCVLFWCDDILDWLDSKIDFVDSNVWLLMGVLYGIERLNALYQAVLASANKVILLKEQIISGLMSLVLLFVVVEEYGITGIIITLFAPRLMLFNIKALKYASISLNQKVSVFGLQTCWPIFLIILIYIERVLS